MSIEKPSTRKRNCKVVYYGPALAGKTTSLRYIYNKVNPDAKGKLVSLDTETERTLFFDFLPLALGEVLGYDTRFHLYTVPGQIFYNTSRKLILKGVDGIVFVADSQVERIEANLESMENLKINLKEEGYNIEDIPIVLQYNKRDLENISAVDELRKLLNPKKKPEFESIAIEGKGVFEALKAIVKHVLTEIKKSAKEE